MRGFCGRKSSPLTRPSGPSPPSAGFLRGQNLASLQARAAPPSRTDGQEYRMEREADDFARSSGPTSVIGGTGPGLPFDFSRIKIHADLAADTACRALNARAFTFGRDVFFAAGEYDPAHAAGRKLFSHELAHILQQEAAGEAWIQRKPRDPPGPKPSQVGRFTEAEYQAWLSSHPKASRERVGPWLPASIYKQYTTRWFASRGYFYSGRVVMDYSSGGYDEVWLNSGENGREYRVYREPARPKAAVESKERVQEDDPADPDVVEAEDYVRDRSAEKVRLILLVKELHRKIGSAEYNGLYDKYRMLEDNYLHELDQNKERVLELWRASQNDDSRDELSDVADELSRQKGSWPYGTEWSPRPDLPRSPGDNLTIKKPVTVTPTGPITF
jgi:hypothetical protein